MPLKRIEAVLTALTDMGLHARRGYAAEKIPFLTVPMATVSIEEAETSRTTLCVRIYVPSTQGGQACEDQSVAAMAALEALGAQCTVGTCAFHAGAGVFYLPIRAAFAEQQPLSLPTVTVDGQVLEDITEVTTAYRRDVTEAEATETRTVTLLQLLPSKTVLSRVSSANFTLTIADGVESTVYENCYWRSVTSETTESGLRVTRVAVAKSAGAE